MSRISFNCRRNYLNRVRFLFQDHLDLRGYVGYPYDDDENHNDNDSQDNDDDKKINVSGSLRSTRVRLRSKLWWLPDICKRNTGMLRLPRERQSTEDKEYRNAQIKAVNWAEDCQTKIKIKKNKCKTKTKIMTNTCKWNAWMLRLPSKTPLTKDSEIFRWLAISCHL